MAYLNNIHNELDCTNGRKAKYLVSFYSRISPYYPSTNYLFSNYKEARSAFNSIKKTAKRSGDLLMVGVYDLANNSIKDFSRGE